MRDITTEEVTTILRKYPKAKEIAVKNFLFTLGNNDSAYNATMNLHMDARSYGWNAQTINAIKAGITLAQK